MRRITYSRYTGEDLGIGAEDLLRALADFFLDSGFSRSAFRFIEFDGRTLEDLHRAIRDALERGLLSDLPGWQQIEQRLAAISEAELQSLVERLARKLFDEGYVSAGEQDAGQPRRVQVEITDKSLDFLGYRALKDLLGALGKANFGAHDTNQLATGIEASGASRPYVFGDTLNLDVTATLLSAVCRQGPRLPLELDYEDLQVRQSEYQSSCATVLMLDASHSMILYGEDRFTPAKKVALALAHLIRTHYPGDSLRYVLFHDRAEELRLSELARAQVGPYYTNTREGLVLAQRLLGQERKDMKQIIMITDGKPSAITPRTGASIATPTDWIRW